MTSSFRLSSILPLAVSLALLALVVWLAGPAALVQAIRGAELRWLVPAALVFTLVTAIHGVRWWVLLRPVGPVPLHGAVLALIVAKAVGVVLPLRAGAVLQVQVLGRRYKLDRGAVAGTLVLEAVIDAGCFLALLIITAPFIGRGPALTTGIWVMAAVVIAAVAALAVLARRRVGSERARAGRGLLVRVRRLTDSVRAGFDAVRSPWAVTAAVALTSADWLLAAVGYAFAGRAFGVAVPPVVYLLVEVVSNLAGAVPFTQAGIGPYEVAVAQLLTRWDIPFDLGSAYAVGAHALLLLTALAAGALALVLLRLRPSDVFYVHRTPETFGKAEG